MITANNGGNHMVTLAGHASGVRATSGNGQRALAAIRALTVRATDITARTADRLRPNLLTVAGLGCIDTGAFTANHIAGWVITGLSILALDWKLDDE